MAAVCALAELAAIASAAAVRAARRMCGDTEIRGYGIWLWAEHDFWMAALAIVPSLRQAGVPAETGAHALEARVAEGGSVAGAGGALAVDRVDDEVAATCVAGARGEPFGERAYTFAHVVRRDSF